MLKQNEKETEHLFSEEKLLKELRSIAWGEATAVLREGRIAVIRVVQTKQKNDGVKIANRW